ncbi:hypothetical protein FNT36_11785 [Hymenobacter setariae]|uniref:Uncharacterized protein n=1 Tax=Hymenobacter setariae TaxID=2594794 RepID=A0A558BUG8_9BACT|nr:hypothetical protein [Hymenobacter setariae]TVT40167.1 hypothetical protein FNT36_11785 [Hymenobacter setariae]
MRKPLWLAPALLLAGCRSEQLVFQSQSATSMPIAVTAPRVLADTTLTATVATARPLGATSTVAPPPAPARQPLAAAAQPIAPQPRHKAALQLPALSKVITAKPIAKKLAHRLRQRSTEGAAESGLGGIGLFVIGVVLALLAGLGALVNVIFGVGFFTGVGYAAAGLVVLFLLYSLFSGGKKKK